jgi:hypothetical protein
MGEGTCLETYVENCSPPFNTARQSCEKREIVVPENVPAMNLPDRLTIAPGAAKYIMGSGASDQVAGLFLREMKD